MSDTPMQVGSIVALDGGGQQDKMMEHMRQMRKLLPLMIENSDLMAELRRANYISLLKQGFNEAQALELCKSIT